MQKFHCTLSGSDENSDKGGGRDATKGERSGFLIKPCEQHENPTGLVNNIMMQSCVHSLKILVLRYFSVTDTTEHTVCW